MNRKLMFFAAALLPLAFLSAQPAKIVSQYELHHQRAIQINELAGHIDSVEDAHKLVDMVAGEFSDELPPRWTTRSLRNRLARAEFESATDPGALIPEQRIADAWNDYVEQIGAPQEYVVTAAELHTLRDSQYASAQLGWKHGIQNLWMMPNIYAVGPDGKVAGGCRALEAIRIVWDLANEPDNLLGARKLTEKGELFSDMIDPAKPLAPSQQRFEGASVSRIVSNPVEAAARQYFRERGANALNHAIRRLLDEVFPR